MRQQGVRNSFFSRENVCACFVVDDLAVQLFRARIKDETGCAAATANRCT